MKNEFAETIGSAARDARERLNMTQKDVAERIGLSTEVYGRLERGYMLPSVKTLRRLCNVLKVSADTLMGMGSTVPTQEMVIVDSKQKRLVVRAMRGLTESQVSVIKAVVNNFRKQL